MSRSPGAALSIAVWIALLAVFSPLMYLGGLPAMVTVTVSIDCLPLPAVMTNSPQRAVGPRLVGVVRCAIVQVDCDEVKFGTVTLIWLSLPEVIVACTPAMVTRDAALQPVLPATGDVQRDPKP